jgi:hypothetical protein
MLGAVVSVALAVSVMVVVSSGGAVASAAVPAVPAVPAGSGPRSSCWQTALPAAEMACAPPAA